MRTYEFSKMAESDLEHILTYTFDKFGKNQMYSYNKQLKDCLKRLANNPAACKIHQIDRKVIRSMHCQRHHIFGLERKTAPLLIIAVLHERMDLIRRLKSRL